MGRPYDHQYHRAGSGSSCGTMICGGCGRPITDGDWRSYKRSKSGDWGYVCHHRKCCADDPQWIKADGAQRAAEQNNAALLAAAKAFRERWKIDDLDNLIDDLSVLQINVVHAPEPDTVCGWCGESILPDQPTAYSDGERMHIGCAAEDMDNATFDRDFGDR